MFKVLVSLDNWSRVQNRSWPSALPASLGRAVSLGTQRSVAGERAVRWKMTQWPPEYLNLV